MVFNMPLLITLAFFFVRKNEKLNMHIKIIQNFTLRQKSCHIKCEIYTNLEVVQWSRHYFIPYLKCDWYSITVRY